MTPTETGKEKNICLQLFASFLKIGAFTFGGGWAMISIIEREIVDRHHWIEKEDFLDLLAIAQSLPGILAVNIATAVGDKMRGLKGSVVAAAYDTPVVRHHTAHRDIPDARYDQEQPCHFVDIHGDTTCGGGTDNSPRHHIGACGQTDHEDRMDSAGCGIDDFARHGLRIQSYPVYNTRRVGRLLFLAFIRRGISKHKEN